MNVKYPDITFDVKMNRVCKKFKKGIRSTIQKIFLIDRKKLKIFDV